MAAPMVKTKHPGIYKRGARYVVVYRVDGRQHKESARTLDEARRLKARRETDVQRGEFHEQSRITLHEYALEWVERYQGRGRRGFRDLTRQEYRRMLKQYPLKYFVNTIRLAEITPARIATFVGWLCDESKQERPLSDKTIRNILGALQACLATATREGLIRSNPARDMDVPHRPTAEDAEEEDAKAMNREQLAAILTALPERQRLLFWFLAATGLRISEAIALQWRHLQLTDPDPHVKVRRGIVRGKPGPPKTRHSRRDVPLDPTLAQALHKHHQETKWPAEEHQVFPASNGAPLHVSHLREDVLRPARKEASLPWVGFHAFRHTCATLLFAEGRNAVQVQRWLGHHSPAFTLATYVHLLDGDLGAPLNLAPQLPKGGNKAATNPTGGHPTTPESPTAKAA
jgi:integrase